MRVFRQLMCLGALALLSACAATPRMQADAPAMPAAISMPGSMSVREINVVVPMALRISEANSYYPAADIVWRGDPYGDRRAQIRDIMQTAFAHGTRTLQGDTPVILEIEVKRFHSVTDRTRLSVGGVHHMVFDLTARDARTGAVIAPSREVETQLKAYGGLRAVQAERRGQTQKVRVTGHLAQVIQAQLGQPVTR